MSPAERERLVAQIGRRRRAAGLPEPRSVIWVGSPLAGTLAATAVEFRRELRRRPVRTRARWLAVALTRLARQSGELVFSAWFCALLVVVVMGPLVASGFDWRMLAIYAALLLAAAVRGAGVRAALRTALLGAVVALGVVLALGAGHGLPGWAAGPHPSGVLPDVVLAAAETAGLAGWLLRPRGLPVATALVAGCSALATVVGRSLAADLGWSDLGGLVLAVVGGAVAVVIGIGVADLVVGMPSSDEPTFDGRPGSIAAGVRTALHDAGLGPPARGRRGERLPPFAAGYGAVMVVRRLPRAARSPRAGSSRGGSPRAAGAASGDLGRFALATGDPRARTARGAVDDAVGVPLARAVDADRTAWSQLFFEAREQPSRHDPGQFGLGAALERSAAVGSTGGSAVGSPGGSAVGSTGGWRDRSDDERDDELDACLAGWWWSLPEDVVICERPTLVRTERDGPDGPGSHRLHCTDGPALAWPDGYALHFWHGVRVPSALVSPGWEPRRIHREADPEVRRAAIERMGWPEYIKAARLPLISSSPDPGNGDRKLELYDLNPPPQQQGGLRITSRVLLMTNGSPDREGRVRQFAELVPGTLQDAVAAAAWQYGCTPWEYRSLRRRT
jgi:hypothetical protein